MNDNTPARTFRTVSYPEWAAAAGYIINSTDDYREPMRLTAGQRRALRKENPNRKPKPSNAAKVNAKKTKRAAKAAKEARNG